MKAKQVAWTAGIALAVFVAVRAYESRGAGKPRLRTAA